VTANPKTSPANSDWTGVLIDLSVLLSSTAVPEPAQPAGVCQVAPLPAIADPEAREFEDALGPVTSGLAPAMSRALERFQELVGSAGGTFVLRSAYRPPAYQAHLQQVWFKWMEMRDNAEPGCQLLRAEVRAEFMGHHLIENQKPVTSSDHTRGLAFDATVLMPRIARLRKRPVSLDGLALLAGVVRPDIVRDPVHYKLAITRGGHTSSSD
jgi:hypothetical protein